jgi:hypothetical protein
VAACAVLAASALPAAAARSPDKYGKFNQNAALFSDICTGTSGNEACGPIALMNSFVFLQNTYPQLDNSLIGADPHATAKKLADLMKCSSTCGTDPLNFFKGKQAYIQSTNDPISSLMFVGPSFKTLNHELDDQEDVEMFIDYYDSKGKPVGGHYVTLWDIQAGFMSFIDPGGLDAADGGKTDGALNEAHVDYKFNDTTKRLELSGYGGTPEGDTARIDYAFAESPITSPEPGTWALMLLGFGALGLSLRARRTAVSA